MSCDHLQRRNIYDRRVIAVSLTYRLAWDLTGFTARKETLLESFMGRWIIGKLGHSQLAAILSIHYNLNRTFIPCTHRAQSFHDFLDSARFVLINAQARVVSPREEEVKVWLQL